jgi:hypothetical protein
MSSVRDFPSGMPSQSLQSLLFPFSTPTPQCQSTPTQSPSTTPRNVTTDLQYHQSLASFPAKSEGCCRATHSIPAHSMGFIGIDSFGTGLIPMPWRSPIVINTRRYHATHSFPSLALSACMCLQTLRYAFGADHNVERCNLHRGTVHVQSSGNVPSPCAGQMIPDLSGSEILRPTARRRLLRHSEWLCLFRVRTLRRMGILLFPSRSKERAEASQPRCTLA